MKCLHFFIFIMSCCFGFFIVASAQEVAEPTEFAYSINQTIPSPGETKTITIPDGYKIVDFDPAPSAPFVLCALASNKTPTEYQLNVFDLFNQNEKRSLPLPSCSELYSVRWHPDAKTIFLLIKTDSNYQIMRGTLADAPDWKPIYSSEKQLSHLLISPTKFSLFAAPSTGGQEQHRIFFGIEHTTGIFGVRSISEYGEMLYDPIAPSDYQSVNKERQELESVIAGYAVPVAFHPSGVKLICNNVKGCPFVATYEIRNWSPKTQEIKFTDICGSHLFFTPNGSGICLWKNQQPGFICYLDKDKQLLECAKEQTFTSQPKWMSDGRGVAAVISGTDGEQLVYIPVSVPLADVTNAWMFVESRQDRELLAKNGGLFRQTTYDQLYEFYDEENYDCGGLSRQTPTRPYLVTTDIFWEVFAASYEGLFQLFERQQAIPAFWQFIEGAKQHFETTSSTPRLKRLFTALLELKNPPTPPSLEVTYMLSADGVHESDVLAVNFDYQDLKPRGHYAANPDLATYFRALRYLASVNFKEEETRELQKIPEELKKQAMAFITPYLQFIAPSRHDIVLSDNQFSKPLYIKHGAPERRFFPLSWGFDNEILNSTVYHETWPIEEQVVCKNGARLTPSSLDIPATFGNSFARSILKQKGIFDDCPMLEKIFDDLNARWKSNQSSSPNLYHKWIEAIGTQWADSVLPPDAMVKPNLWNAKRLQTGLASWATLRHATVLVNERSVAECGEGGFEDIIVAPPLGAVESDPDTFQAIADLFTMETELMNNATWSFTGTMYAEDTGEDVAIKNAVLKRLEESKALVLSYKEMAKKQIEGKALTAQEYYNIFWVGRAAEYNFLVFKSLAKDDFALSSPDPVPKIVDIAGGGPMQIPYLHIAVGKPAEWDLVVPFFGKHQIVKGIVYTVNEFSKDKIVNDEEWRKQVDQEPPVYWTKEFYSSNKPTCPPEHPF